MDWQAAFTVFTAVLALAMKPGPGMMAIMSRTLLQGMKACFVFMTGFCIVCMIYLSLVLAGLKFVRDDLLFISMILKALAAVYLIYLGLKGLQNLDVDLTLREHKQESLFETFTGAMMLTIANPLIILFSGDLLPTVIDIQTLTLADGIVIGAIICSVETGVAVAYCLPVALSRSAVTSKSMRNINLAASVIMIMIGLLIGYSAMTG